MSKLDWDDDTVRRAVQMLRADGDRERIQLRSELKEARLKIHDLTHRISPEEKPLCDEIDDLEMERDKLRVELEEAQGQLVGYTLGRFFQQIWCLHELNIRSRGGTDFFTRLAEAELECGKLKEALKTIAGKSVCACWDAPGIGSGRFYKWIGCAVHNSADPEEWCLCCIAHQALSSQEGVGKVCEKCGGSGEVKVDGCTCAAVDIGVGIQHEPTCGTEQCPACGGSGEVPDEFGGITLSGNWAKKIPCLSCQPPKQPKGDCFVCPECGPEVPVDEDGCCHNCGADCQIQNGGEG